MGARFRCSNPKTETSSRIRRASICFRSFLNARRLRLPPTTQSKAPITALSYGADWYARAGYQGEKALEPSAALAKYVGEYYSENPWYGTIRVVQRQRQLWMGGTDPLMPIGNHLFRIGTEATGPGVVEFSELIGEKPYLLWIDGVQFRRIEETA